MLKILGGGGTEEEGDREEAEDMKHKLITTLTMGETTLSVHWCLGRRIVYENMHVLE